MSAKKIKMGHFPSVSILGVRVDVTSRREAVGFVAKSIEDKAKLFIVTPNPEQVMTAQKDRQFRAILNEASLALCDGVGLIFAQKILRSSIKYSRKTRQGELQDKQVSSIKGEKSSLARVTGEETMRELVELAKERGWKVMLLGGKKGVAAEAAEKFQLSIINYQTEKQKSKFTIKGINGHRDISSYTREENERVIAEINEFQPDLLFVAYGAPWQEKWLWENLDRLDVKVGMAVGGAFDMVVDPTLRPPGFMTKVGLDWLYRLLRQPWRLFRQLALAQFLVEVLLVRERT